MLTYTPNPPNPPNLPRPARPTYEKPWILLLLAFAWLWPGVFGHDLWKPDEIWVNEAVRGVLAGGAPSGRETAEISFVYLWLAALCRRLLSPLGMDAYSAMRLANVLFCALGLTACGMAGFRLAGRHHGRSVVLILIGCAGLVANAHLLGGRPAEFAALGLCLYGLSVARRQVIFAALLLALGWSLLITSAGLAAAGALMAACCLLPLSAPWRGHRIYVVLALSCLLALPPTLACLFALYRVSEESYRAWLQYGLFGMFGGTASFSLSFQPLYYLKNLLWFAFPAWPLALWTCSRRGFWREDWAAPALLWLAFGALLLAFAPKAGADRLLLVLPPLALLGAARLDALKRGVAAFFNWFGFLVFFLSAAFLWAGFSAMNFGRPAKLAERSAYFSPYYVADFAWTTVVVAALSSALWLWLWAVTWKKVRGRQAVTNWAAGVTMVWILLMTLFLPWLDAAKSHRPVVRLMEEAAPPTLKTGGDCFSIDAESALARAVWREYGRLQPADNAACRYRLLQTDGAADAPAGWRTVWQGARPRNKHERFMLLERAG